MQISGIQSLATAVSWLAKSSTIGSFCSRCGSPVGSCSCGIAAISHTKNYKDTVEISDAGREKSAQNTNKTGENLSDEEKREVEKLKRTDTEVRAHEAAHLAAGGGVVRGGAKFSYKKGSDGLSYAVGGEVSIDTSEGKTPEETIAKMERVKAAALAPANPSGQDLRVAAEASSKLSEARSKKARVGEHIDLFA